LFFNAFGNAPQSTVGMGARFHEAAEPQVFIAFLARKAALDKTGEHYLSV
jgi:hypothetical protein